VDGGQRHDLHPEAEEAVPADARCARQASSNVPFIMPERIAKTDPFKNLEDPIGSGPFKMVKAEWVPGNKVVYIKNTDYVPRKEAPSWASGGKVVKVDRVEWIYIRIRRPRLLR
jgi:ABC-type transport system substrate-binding protein